MSESINIEHVLPLITVYVKVLQNAVVTDEIRSAYDSLCYAIKLLGIKDFDLFVTKHLKQYIYEGTFDSSNISIILSLHNVNDFIDVRLHCYKEEMYRCLCCNNILITTSDEKFSKKDWLWIRLYTSVKPLANITNLRKEVIVSKKQLVMVELRRDTDELLCRKQITL